MSVVTDPPEVKQEAPSPVTLLPDECPLTGRIRNFKVEVASFGAYKRGSILPKHVLLRSAGAGAVGRESAVIDAMLTSRRFSQTYDPVNVKLSVPKEMPGEDAVLPSLTRDVNDAKAKLAKLEQDHVAVCKDRDEWKAKVGSRDASLGAQTDQITSLQGQLASRDEVMEKAQAEIASLTRQVADLTAQLDEATKPKGAQKKAVAS